MLKKLDLNFDIEVNRIRALVGLVLIALGLAAPALLPASAFRIYETTELAAREWQDSYLLVAALKLVLLNSLRSFPHYLGTFLVIQAIQIDGKVFQIVKNVVLSSAIILLIYYLIELLYGVRYDFAIPAVLIILMLLFVDRLDFSMIRLGKELLLLIMIIMTIQFLDVFPGLSDSLFGRGELSTYIKTLASLMEAEKLLRGMCLIFMFILLFSAVVQGTQISLENSLRKARKESEESREQLIDARTKLIESRFGKEQQFLVHDLKAPLTSIQIWADIMRMRADSHKCEDCVTCLNHVDGSISHMNTLITEIMNSKTKNVFTVNDVMKLFSSQTSPAIYSSMLSVNCDCGDCKIEVNRTNFVRALINITDNASHSIHHEHGSIKVKVTEDGDYINFAIRDNGEGIEEEMLDRIWEKGISGRNSSGVGLFFVREVVTEAEGTVSIDSTVGVGTTVTIRIPEYQDLF